jgi:hypothetical protein
MRDHFDLDLVEVDGPLLLAREEDKTLDRLIPYPFADEQAHSVSPLPVGINRQRFPDEDSERSSKVHKEDIDEYSSSTKLNREDHIVSG